MFKDFKFKNPLTILIGIAVFIIAVALFAIGYNNLKTKPQQKLTSEPPVSEELSSKEEFARIKKELTATDKTSGDLVMVQNENMEIIYLISNDEFMVNIKKDPFADNKKIAEDWFKSKGFKAGDLCFLRIFFYPAKEVTVKYSAENVMPTGCQAISSTVAP